ncbi:MAG: hypothetical protein VKQ33_03930 [Candidatus Sericytochromatia bacterium]|nr:hypothetical protein [Candidatus Sericytochromatia bacterium]
MKASEELLGLTVAEATARVEACAGSVPALLKALPPRQSVAPLPLAAWRVVRVDVGPAGPRWVVSPPMALAPREDAKCSG